MPVMLLLFWIFEGDIKFHYIAKRCWLSEAVCPVCKHAAINHFGPIKLSDFFQEMQRPFVLIGY